MGCQGCSDQGHLDAIGAVRHGITTGSTGKAGKDTSPIFPVSSVLPVV